MTATWHTGDSLTVLRTLPDNSVDLILTSPPFLALRSYLPADDPNKPLEMGSEATPGQFLDALLDVVVECRRVLAPHGSLCVELGDTYAGSGGAGGDYGPVGLRAGQAGFDGSAARTRSNRPGQYGTTTGPTRRVMTDAWPLDKSLCLIPEAFRFALAYGRNPHTGRTLEPWRIRNVIRWCRPNPPVGALGDKMRPATSDIAVACMSGKRYFDLDAVRMPFSQATIDSDGYSRNSAKFEERINATAPERTYSSSPKTNVMTHAGAPPLDHWWHNPDTDDLFDQDAWLISTEPYPGSHYATWPRALCIKPILAMCPQKVCTVCGKPSERLTENSVEYDEYRKQWVSGIAEGKGAHSLTAGRDTGTPSEMRSGGRGGITAQRDTLGWSDCGHNNWRPGHVLDPFAGSGTTGVVATGHGRTFTGIDLDPRNYDLARERIGMWLDHADTQPMVDVPTKGLL